jgi:hypothetical protein
MIKHITLPDSLSKKLRLVFTLLGFEFKDEFEFWFQGTDYETFSLIDADAYQRYGEEIDDILTELVNFIDESEYDFPPKSDEYELKLIININDTTLTIKSFFMDVSVNFEERIGTWGLNPALKGIYTCSYEGLGDNGYITKEKIKLDGKVLDPKKYSSMYSSYSDTASLIISREFPGYERNDDEEGGKFSINSNNFIYKIKHKTYERSWARCGEFTINLKEEFKKWKLK